MLVSPILSGPMTGSRCDIVSAPALKGAIWIKTARTAVLFHINFAFHDKSPDAVRFQPVTAARAQLVVAGLRASSRLIIARIGRFKEGTP
jgi:hypothetical protein